MLCIVCKCLLAFWKVLWSDVTKMYQLGYNGHCYIWRIKGEAFSLKNTIPTVENNGGSITSMLCKCFAGNETGALQNIDGIIKK